MTLIRNQTGSRRRNALRNVAIVKAKKSIGVRKYLKQLTAPPRVLAIEAASPWICTSTSWSDVMEIEKTPSEICTSVFSSWTIYDEPECEDNSLEECMDLFNRWLETLEMLALNYEDLTLTCNCTECIMSGHEESAEESATDASTMSSIEWCSCCEQMASMEAEDPLEESMTLFLWWSADGECDNEEIMVEPEIHDSLLMSALLSTKEGSPSLRIGGLLGSISCPNLLMDSLATLLFETRHLHFINQQFSLPPPPKWIMEMDPPNSVVSTVSLPSDWDAVSDLSHRSASLLSTFSMLGFACSSSPSVAAFPSTCSLFMDPSEVSSSSSLFLDPSSSSSLFLDPSSSSSLFPDPSSSHSLFSIDPYGCSSSHSSDYFHTMSSIPDDGYESDVDTWTPLLKKTTVSSTEPAQTRSAYSMLSECDRMLEKIVELKKKLKEML